MATHKQLCAAVEPTPIGEILVSVDGVECEEFYRNYLHDFIRLVHKCNHKDREYELQEYEVRKGLRYLLHYVETHFGAC